MVGAGVVRGIGKRITQDEILPFEVVVLIYELFNESF